MKINVTLPFDNIENPAGVSAARSREAIGALLERVGFMAANVTDHPCPTGRWLDSGGHYAQDPFVMLSLLAAATHKVAAADRDTRTCPIAIPSSPPVRLPHLMSSPAAASRWAWCRLP